MESESSSYSYQAFNPLELMKDIDEDGHSENDSNHIVDEHSTNAHLSLFIHEERIEKSRYRDTDSNKSIINESPNVSENVVVVDCPQTTISSMEKFVTYRLQIESLNPNLSTYFKSSADGEEVRRRFNDFIYLRSQLSYQYPTRIIPPLPEKLPLSTMDRFGDHFIERRCFGLQRFLQRTINHPIFSTASVLFHFLTDCSFDWQMYKSSHTLPGKLVRNLSDAVSSIKSLASAGASSFEEVNNDSSAVEKELVSQRDVFTCLKDTAHRMSLAEQAQQACNREVAKAVFELLQLERSDPLRNAEFEEAPCGNARPSGAKSELALSTVYAACDAWLHASETLGEHSEERFAQPLHEQMLYVDVVRSAVRRVHGLSVSYKRCRQAASVAHSEAADQFHEQSDSRKTHVLHDRVELLHDELAKAQADLASDLSRWVEDKHHDSKQLFCSLADANISALRESLTAWEAATATIVASCRKADV